jgi:hypothetical protein
MRIRMLILPISSIHSDSFCIGIPPSNADAKADGDHEMKAAVYNSNMVAPKWWRLRGDRASEAGQGRNPRPYRGGGRDHGGLAPSRRGLPGGLITAVAGRLMFGVFGPRKKVLGSDFAGTVAEVGPGVTEFAEGDRVFGMQLGGDACGIHAKVKADGAVLKTPETPRPMSEAAALPFGAIAFAGVPRSIRGCEARREGSSSSARRVASAPMRCRSPGRWARR